MRAPTGLTERPKWPLSTTRVQDAQDATRRRLAHGAARPAPAADTPPASRPCSHLPPPPPPSAALALEGVHTRKGSNISALSAPTEDGPLRPRSREAPPQQQ